MTELSRKPVPGALLASTLVLTLMGCSQPAPPQPDPTPSTTQASPPAPSAQPQPAQPRLASDPAQLADQLVSDEWTLRDPSSSPQALVDAARRQQAAYRTLGRKPEWDAAARAQIPQQLRDVFDRNLDARRHLTALSRGGGKPTVPAWRIVIPPPVDELIGYYRTAEAATGVGWNYLAAINFVETAFGRIDGVSTAGAQGPMQFLPSTFAAYGDGGDIRSPHDSIMAAGRFLAAHGFAGNPDDALFRYNNSRSYVRAVSDYAALIGAHPSALAGYHRWDVYYGTTAGDVVLPVGYAATSPVPVGDFLAANPQ